MKQIVQFVLSRLSRSDLCTWAQLSLGPTPFPVMMPRSTPDIGVIGAGFMTFAAALLLLLIVGVSVKVYGRTRKREKEKDRITITPGWLGRAA